MYVHRQHRQCSAHMASFLCAAVQELCLALMSLLVLQQPQHADMVSSAANHALWLLECAAQGQLPAELLCMRCSTALAACLSSCIGALHALGLLDWYCDRCGLHLLDTLACWLFFRSLYWEYMAEWVFMTVLHPHWGFPCCMQAAAGFGCSPAGPLYTTACCVVAAVDARGIVPQPATCSHSGPDAASASLSCLGSKQGRSCCSRGSCRTGFWECYCDADRAAGYLAAGCGVACNHRDQR